MHILKLNKTCTFAKAKRELEVVCGMSAAARTSGNIVYRRCWRGTCAGIAARTRSIYIDQCSSTSSSWCLLNDRTHSRCIHYMHSCSSARTSANCSQSLHICRYTCSGQNFSGHVTWLMCIYLTATLIYYQQGCSIGYLYRYLICT